jgi:hypothetical protein
MIVVADTTPLNYLLLSAISNSSLPLPDRLSSARSSSRIATRNAAHSSGMGIWSSRMVWSASLFFES